MSSVKTIRSSAKSHTSVIEHVIEKPLLDHVLDATPAQVKQPDIPEGYTVLPKGVWYMRVNPKFLKGQKVHPIELYQSNYEEAQWNTGSGNLNGSASVWDYGDSNLKPCYDMKVWGQTEMVCVQHEGCGSTFAVRLRIKSDATVAIKLNA